MEEARSEQLRAQRPDPRVPSRALATVFNKYNGKMLEMIVAHAIVSGILDPNALPEELLDHLRAKIVFYEELAAEGEE